MTTLLPARPISLWRDVICPKEHGSWSLAGEPIALALLVAPSLPGALLGASLLAAFFARRPVRALVLERRAVRRAAAIRAVLVCGATALATFGAAVVMGGTGWLAWLLPSVVAGAAFAFCDARGEGREELAELAGATAFALTPIALGVAGGLSAPAAVALGLVMVARAAPSVATVRAFLRAAKTGERHVIFPLVASLVGVVTVGLVVAAGWAPRFAAAVTALLALRAWVLLVAVRPAWRARTVGMAEAAIGVLFVISVAISWTT